MASSKLRNNENKAKKSGCYNCEHCHIGKDVDHNHCNFSNEPWYQNKSNGNSKEKCIHKRERDWERLSILSPEEQRDHDAKHWQYMKRRVEDERPHHYR